MSDNSPCSETLTKVQRELELILAHAGEGIYGLDKFGKTTFVNNAAAQMVDLNLSQLQGKCNHSLVHHHRIDGSDYPKEECPIYKTLQDGLARHGEDEYFMRADGSFFPIEYFVNPIIDDDETIGVVVTFIDITTRKERQQQLHEYQTRLEEMVEEKTIKLKTANEALIKISFLDGLTGIANRRAFDKALTSEIRRSARARNPITLMLADVDFFKKYNDTYGHHEGDICLKKIAQAIDDTFKRAGDVVARYGGEEFGVILPEMNLEQVKQKANHLLSNIRKLKIAHEDSDCNNFISISLGIVHMTPSPDDSKKLIESADKALYQAKKSGRNQMKIFDNS
jgi:diguanylate cyclase (GGDEF)-like protein/PAS domain S-box-containing protein